MENMMMSSSSKIAEIESAQLRSGLPDFRVGDTVRVHYKIVEGDKDRIQVFQGLFYLRDLAGKAARVRDQKDS
jgi:large subunit ribosomal protein L19